MADEISAPEPFPIPATDEELLSQCRMETFTAGGKGGQHQNRTESGVRLVHLPTGVTVTSREERSQHRNKTTALSRLRERLERRNRRPARRVPTSVPRGEKEKRLRQKKQRSETKLRRKSPPVDPAE
jgi:protein subunit release factor A